MQHATIAGGPVRLGPDRRNAPAGPEPRSASPVAALLALRELECLRSPIAASWHTSAPLLQQRAQHRVRYHKPVLVVPLDEGTEQPLAETLWASGHDISLMGLSFMHHEPLACRLVAVRFPSGDAPIDAIVTRLNWCRFTRRGLYQSGGVFLRTIRLAEH